MIAVAYLASGALAVAIWPSMSGSADSLDFDLLARAYCLQTLAIAPLLAMLAHFPGQPFWETLAVRAVSVRQVAVWLAVYAVFQLLVAALGVLFDSEPDEFMTSLAGTRHVGLALVVIVLAPLLEEAVFRGYLFQAWRASALGEWGTIAVTALLFTALHAGQYQPLLLAQLLGFALILGLARARTRSVVTPWLLHAANNSLVVGVVMFAPGS